MGAMTVKKETRGSNLCYDFVGQIDEDASFAALDPAGNKSIVFNLEGVASVNSCGIREWIKWLKTFPSDAKITYSRCPKLIVDQMNMVAGFFPKGATVESFFVPYYCEECGTENLNSFNNGKEFSGKQVSAPESIKCTKCGAAAEIDVIESKYFKFLETQG